MASELSGSVHAKAHHVLCAEIGVTDETKTLYSKLIRVRLAMHEVVPTLQIVQLCMYCCLVMWPLGQCLLQGPHHPATAIDGR